MNIKEAKLLFQAGVLEDPVIRRVGEQGWTVVLEGRHQLKPELETTRGGVRVFKTADAAVGVVFELGFEKIEVVR